MQDYIEIGMWLQGFVGALLVIIYFRINGFKKYSQLNGLLYSVLVGFITIPISLLSMGNIFQSTDLFGSIFISSISGFLGAQLGYNIAYFLYKDKKK